jgi:endonuclease G, mitochondrial
MRRDISERFDPKLSAAIRSRRRNGAVGPAAMRMAGSAAAMDVEALIGMTPEAQSRVVVRQSLIEPQERDPNGRERLIGISDLCSINFLSRGLAAAKSVARIRVRQTSGFGEWYGTGFLAAPGLLLTNHHVLRSMDEAALAVVEFDFEHDVHGVESTRRVFNVTPSRLFFTDAELDCTFVALAPRSFEGMPLDEFGHLPLIPQSGKAIDGEWLTMIQHPGGQPKQIAIRDSQVVALSQEDVLSVDPNIFIHYTTDSEPGSSGAPVFNDQWQVVALHHRGVPDFNERGERLARDGQTVWTEDMGEDAKGWIANEGIRVSALYQMLASRQFTSHDARTTLDRLRFGLSLGKRSMAQVQGPTSAESELEAQGADSTADFFDGLEGYDVDFLSRRVPRPKDNTRKEHQAKLEDSNGTELKYTHFSIVFDSDRRFARYTAVNIDGSRLHRNSGVTKSWRRDGRIDVEIQPDDDFYVKSLAEESVYFQRGHLVRRVDPSWGTPEEAKRAVEDTFHFTNAAPHVGQFNDTIWGNLEDYLLEKCDVTEKRMSVFSGPIFRSTDPSNYGIERRGGPYTIPVDYWKVVVIQKTPTKIAAAAFMIGHGSLLDALHEEERVFSGLHPFTPAELVDQGIQTSIASIEEATGLSFGTLKQFDSVDGLESTFRSRPLRTFSDIVI